MTSVASDWTYLAMAAPFLAAIVAPFLTRLMGASAAWLLALVPALMFLFFTGFLGLVAADGFVGNGFTWVDQLNVRFSYRIDGLSLLFALLITGIGTFIILYSGAYMKGHPQQGRFFSFMFLFMGSMLGLVLADDFITLFIFWEMTSITSFLLIGFNHARRASRRAAIQALVVTGGGGLALLAGFLMLIMVTGGAVTSMTTAIDMGRGFVEHPFYLAVLILLLGGAFTKSAQFPFHFWLPNAMEAPTPVSAYLHSATMVKAGVYLVMRIHPFMGDTPQWGIILTVFGGITLLVGTVLAIRQTDLKLILAYTTVASLGLLVMLTGTSINLAIIGAVTYLLAHSLFKGALFMVAGGIDHEAGTRDITRLGGLRTSMPITFGAALLAAWSMGGLPFTVGFFGKEMMYEALAHGSGLALGLLVVAVVGNSLMFAAGFAVALYPFIGPKVETPKVAHDGPIGLWIGPVVLAICGFAFLIMGKWTAAHLVGPARLAIMATGHETYMSTAIYLNEALALSVVTVILGAIVWWKLVMFRDLFARLLKAIGWGPDHGFDQFITGLTQLSARITVIFQSGNLRNYMMVTFVVTALTVLVPMTVYGEWPSLPSSFPLNFYEWSMVALAIAGLLAVLVAQTRLIAIVSLGIQGFAVALLFMLFGAPDLSFTQFMVETLSVVILALVMTRLSLAPSDFRSPVERLRDGTIAIACGVGFGSLLIAATAGPFDERLTTFFERTAEPIAHGRNIVNVILVDYRGVDTLGEIAVVMVAGLSVLALMRVRASWSKPGAPRANADEDAA